jgi:hypothetical protein
MHVQKQFIVDFLRYFPSIYITSLLGRRFSLCPLLNATSMLSVVGTDNFRRYTMQIGYDWGRVKLYS